MRIYDNAPDSYHVELASFFPLWYSEIAEMDAIWRVTGGMLDEVKTDIERVLNNTFVGECDQDTVIRLESYFGIKFDSPRSDDERRRFLAMMFAGFGKCSATKIQSMIRKYTQADTSISFKVSDENGNHTLYIDVERGELERFYFSDITSMLKKMIPAHVQYSMCVVFETHMRANVSLQHWVFDYDQAGVRPDTQTLGRQHNLIETANTNVVDNMFAYPVAEDD